MSDFLKDKVAVITGASRGLGKAMALALAGEGVKLALAARDEAKLAEVAAEARRLGVDAECYRVDVTSESDVLAFEEKARARFGKVQILINNAGVNLRKPVTEFTYQEWRYVLDTNLTGAFLMCRSFVPHMKGSGYGRILNLTSTMSHVSLPERIAYSSSKAGLLGMTKALALELATEGVTVVGISPGPFATEMNAPRTRSSWTASRSIAGARSRTSERWRASCAPKRLRSSQAPTSSSTAGGWRGRAIHFEASGGAGPDGA
jgi:NAD(P)-dependent dehydrogenase (short-subunit alcohol dehydrogenase family)